MNAQIRLAERQGLLTGRHLSQVQVNAVYLRELQDLRERAERNTFDLKRSFLATGNVSFADLFPEATRSEDDVEAAEALAENPQPGTTTIWKFQDADFDPAEADRMLDELLAASEHTVNGREVLDWGTG